MIKLEEYIKLPITERKLHLKLEEPCLERGGNSTNHRGVLAQYLNTWVSAKGVVLAHACNNGNCSNPNHLYWGTHRENTVEDGTKFGTWKSSWQRMVEKYGYEEACKMNSRKNKSKGKPFSEEHKRKLREAHQRRRDAKIKALCTVE